MNIYVCHHCYRAFYGPACPKNPKIRPFLTCPGCGCHKARKASPMEERIIENLRLTAHPVG